MFFLNSQISVSDNGSCDYKTLDKYSEEMLSPNSRKNRVYTVRENQGKTYLFRDGQGKSGKIRESQGIQRKSQGKLGKSQGDFLESSYLL